MEHPPLNSIVDEDKSLPFVYTWPFVVIKDDTLGVRLYYNKRDEEKNGFKFYFVSIVASSFVPEVDDNPWHPDHVDVEILFNGVAYWDGVRHLYLGSEQTGNYGYIYYPDINLHIKMLQALQELEKIYCKES